MKLIVISNPDFIQEEAEIINGLFVAGLECLHLRKPDSTEKEMRELIEKINPVFYNRLSLHQHHILTKHFGIFRLHYTENDRHQKSEEKLQKLKEEGYKLSTSIHNLEQVNLLSPYFDYTFFSPVFDSISKSDYKSNLPQNFFLSDELKKIPIIGLGGIDIENIQEVKKMNFDGAAVLGTLWKDPMKAVDTFARLGKSSRLAKSNPTHPNPIGVTNFVAPGFKPGIEKLQFISNQTNELTHLESIQIALDSGCTWVQLRIKNQSPGEILKQAVKAKSLCDQYQAKLIINDFPLIAREVSAYGLHLGLEDMSIKEAREIVGNEMIIGGTANTFEHILLRLNEGADYIGLGPFRFTSTKEKLSPVLGINGFQLIMKHLKELGKTIPVIAIGGILPEDISDLTAIGVHGIAMSSALIYAKNRKEMVTNIYKILC